MVRYTDEEKAARKNTIKAWNYMKTRDQVLGIRPTAPPLVIHHPRHFDPPPSCRSGLHHWETTVLMNIPILKCKKCGRIVMRGSYEGTETKREIRTKHMPKPRPFDEPFTEVEW